MDFAVRRAVVHFNVRIAQTRAIGTGIEVNRPLRTAPCQNLLESRADGRINVGNGSQRFCLSDKLNGDRVLRTKDRRNQDLRVKTKLVRVSCNSFMPVRSPAVFTAPTISAAVTLVGSA